MTEYKLRDERATLEAVARRMEEGEIGKPPKLRKALSEASAAPAAAFLYMAGTAAPFDCGTVACVGGFAWLEENPGDFAGADRYVMGVKEHLGDVEEDNPLHLLYYPDNLAVWDHLTPVHAAVAIRNYLAGDADPWEEIAEEIVRSGVMREDAEEA